MEEEALEEQKEGASLRSTLNRVFLVDLALAVQASNRELCEIKITDSVILLTQVHRYPLEGLQE